MFDVMATAKHSVLGMNTRLVKYKFGIISHDEGYIDNCASNYGNIEEHIALAFQVLQLILVRVDDSVGTGASM